MSDEINMMDDWLSVALSDDAANHRTASTNRAMIAVKHRTDKRFERYLKGAQSATEFEARVSAIDDEIRLMANEVAIEHSAPEPELLYQAAVKRAYDFGAPFQQGQQGTPTGGGQVSCPGCGGVTMTGQPCPTCGNMNQPGQEAQPQGMGGLRNRLQPMAAEVPADGYDRRTVDPDEAIGTTPASSSGESLKKNPKTLDAIRKNDKSKAHPQETQDPTDRVEDRKDWNNPGADSRGFGGTPPVEHKVDKWNLADLNQFDEQVGPDTSTFGDGKDADPVTKNEPVLGSVRWHVLEG